MVQIPAILIEIIAKQILLCRDGLLLRTGQFANQEEENTNNQLIELYDGILKELEHCCGEAALQTVPMTADNVMVYPRVPIEA